LIVLAYRDGDIALHFFDLLDYFELGGGVEHIPTSPEEQLEMLGHISSSDVDSLD
jgi:hypothetical protein